MVCVEVSQMLQNVWIHEGQDFKVQTLGVKIRSITHYLHPWNDPLWRKITSLKDTDCVLFQDITTNITDCNTDASDHVSLPTSSSQSCARHLSSKSCYSVPSLNVFYSRWSFSLRQHDRLFSTFSECLGEIDRNIWEMSSLPAFFWLWFQKGESLNVLERRQEYLDSELLSLFLTFSYFYICSFQRPKLSPLP